MKCRGQIEWIRHQHQMNSVYSVNQSLKSGLEHNHLRLREVYSFCCGYDVLDGYELSRKCNGDRSDCIQLIFDNLSPSKTN